MKNLVPCHGVETSERFRLPNGFGLWWCPSELLQVGKRHQSMSGVAEGIPHCKTPATSPTQKLEKKRKISEGLFYIYTPGKRSTVTQTAAWLGVSAAASICVSWAFQAGSWRHQRTYEISTRRVSQKRTSIFPANPVPLPGWHMWGMLCVASFNYEVTPSCNDFPKSLQQVSLVTQVGFFTDLQPGLSLSEDRVPVSD